MHIIYNIPYFSFCFLKLSSKLQLRNKSFRHENCSSYCFSERKQLLEVNKKKSVFPILEFCKQNKVICFQYILTEMASILFTSTSHTTTPLMISAEE